MELLKNYGLIKLRIVERKRLVACVAIVEGGLAPGSGYGSNI